MQEMFRRAYKHPGASFVEVLQNCNVFNDGAFSAITKKDVRADMLIDLHHGEPILFGGEKQFGVVANDGEANIVNVDEVGSDSILVHDESREDPSRAFALSRLSETPDTPTPVGVFRAVEREEYSTSLKSQIDGVVKDQGAADLNGLLHSLPTWEV